MPKSRAAPASNSRVPVDAENLTETQRRLLTAALDVFAEKGYAGASTAEIARAAGVAEKTLFAHFGTKHDLLLRTLSPSVLTLLEPQVLEGIKNVARPGLTLREALTALLTDRLAIVRRHPKHLKFVVQELLLRPDMRTTFAETAKARIAPLVLPVALDLIARGELRADIPLPVVLRTVVSVTFGYAASRYILGLEASSPDDAIEIRQLVDVLVRALGRDATPPPDLAMPPPPTPAAVLAPSTPPSPRRR